LSASPGAGARLVAIRRTYYGLVTDTRVVPKVAWTYLNPTPGFGPIAGAIAVMAALTDRCIVNGPVAAPATAA